MILKRNGFTLIEIIIALTILGIGLVSVLGYLPIALDVAKKAADLTKATFIAQKLIEEIKAESYDDITNADSFDTAGLFVTDIDYSNYSYKIEVSNSGAATSKDLTLTIRWRFKGKDSIEVFKTKIVKYNPT